MRCTLNIKNVFYLVQVLLIIVIFSCSAGSKNEPEVKDKTMIFDLKGIACPVELVNYQRNSFIPIEVRRQWRLSWSKKYTEIDSEMGVSPRSIHIKGDIIGLKSASELIVYDASGNFKFMEAINNPSPVIFGAEGIAFLNEAKGLVYQDYNQKELRVAEPVPGLDEWASALLMKPSMEEVLAVVQNAGIRGHREKKYYIYRFVREDLTSKWYYEFPGIVNDALLSADDQTLIVLKGEEVIFYDVENGNNNLIFKTGLVVPIASSISLDNELLIIGTMEDQEEAVKYLKTFSFDGEELWSAGLKNPVMKQPPVCGTEGYVYLVDSMRLKCFVKGETKWASLPQFGDNVYLTVAKDNDILVLNGPKLYLYDSTGNNIFESIITREDEAFNVPPVIDAQGKIYVASDKRLYCFE